MKAILDFFINHIQSLNGTPWIYLALFAIIFAETGLLVGFFLPGDSLLFIVASLVAAGTLRANMALLVALLIVAAVVGDGVGYLIGRKFGPGLFARPNSRLFKREHLLKTQAFYDKHGPKTIVMARFVPIVRTFAPTVAGAAGMHYRKFALYNVLGGAGWIALMCGLGYKLGSVPWVKDNIEKASILIVLISILPIVIHALLERRAAHNEASA